MRLSAWICLLAVFLLVSEASSEVSDSNRLGSSQCPRGCERFNYHGFSECVNLRFRRILEPWMRYVIDANHADQINQRGGTCRKMRVSPMSDSYNIPMQCQRGCVEFSYHGFTQCLPETFIRSWAPLMRTLIDSNRSFVIGEYFAEECSIMYRF